ncbi:MAG: L-serine ammonia-lyase, iron-sulfur-dependent, subunit alpha [Paludibacteraceae bacterium]|nr:L-serine ammonia-lyase, iron-sulfur-dependent, subunit alpha [Paludibacteraceae bacterium]
MNDPILHILHREVIPAIGCTEPIAVALCVARAKEQLGVEPDAIEVQLSKNIYKNALSVGIPNTGMTGLPIAVALGATIGRSEWQLEVLRDTTPEAVAYAREYMEQIPIRISIVPDAPDVLYIHTTVHKGAQQAQSTTVGSHTGQIDTSDTNHQQESKLSSFRQVYDYALNVQTQDVLFLLDGAEMNLRAAEYAFEHPCGHCLGRILAKHDNGIFERILAYTSGACDARMSGAMVSVMSNSGSGNQGISCSVPVLLYARHIGASEEQTIRALTLSNLTVIYIKQSLGRLSALCGCVVAATGSAVGITMLKGGQYEETTYAIKNMIANISGMICDGAKPGCALKVTSGVATAVIAASLAMEHSYPEATEGIIDEDIDCTIHNLTRIGHDGMSQTDDLILQIMSSKQFPLLPHHRHYKTE